MELKVWVEGIQRIVCGVNEKTTCQDVVFALAHATGKTGRFTLIERWRNSERLLAPSEQPLKVLLKWGEHSNDVQFILQWSPLDPSATANKSGQLQLGKGHLVESSCSDNSSSHSPSPLSKSNHQFVGSPSTLSSSSGVASSPLSQVNGPSKKPNSGSSSSYTSNDPRLWSSYSQNGLHGPTATTVTPPPHDTFQNGDGRIPSATGSMRGVPPQTRRLPVEQLFYSSSKLAESSSGTLADAKLSSPPPYREPPSPSSYSTPPLISPQGGQNSPSMKSLPPYREPPPPNLPTSAPTSFGNKAVSVTSTNLPTVFNGGSGGAQSNANGLTNNGLHGFNVPSQKDLAKYASVNPSLSLQQDSLSSINSSNDVENWKTKDQNLANGKKSPNQNGSIPKVAPVSYSSNSNSNYREIIRVVNTQREKLTSQQAELTQYDAEIMFWEGKAREQQKHMDLINKEISRLEVISAQHESQVLSLAHLEEEQEYSQRDSVALKSEIDSLHLELEKCDDEIEQCKKRIRILMEELHLTQHQMQHRQQEWLEKETATLAEIDRLRKELELTRRETEDVNDISGNIGQEVQSIEASLSEKKKQMERLVSAMKEANLQSLSIQPPEDLIEVHHRSGSTRRMIGSPRQLENAAPTSKNPHGVWV